MHEVEISSMWMTIIQTATKAIVEGEIDLHKQLFFQQKGMSLDTSPDLTLIPTKLVPPINNHPKCFKEKHGLS